jgi:hypothetical protein
MAELERREFTLDEEKGQGTYALSLVESPAMQSGFITLSEEKVKLKMIDNKRGVIMGVALIPDRDVLRKGKDGAADYYLYFSKETVRRSSEIFLENNYHQNSTLGHEVKLDGNVVIESWIKEDEVNDKSVMHGLDAPVGSWIVTMKAAEKYIQMAEDGTLNGFSIEGIYEDEDAADGKVEQEDEQTLALYEGILAAIELNIN